MGKDHERVTDDVNDSAIGELFRRQVRDMFRLADRPGCRHQSLVRHFGEKIDACGTSCDSCRKADVVAEAPAMIGRGKKRTWDSRAAPVATPNVPTDDAGAELLRKLKALRKRIADSKNLPAYIVFSDAALIDMVHLKPRTEDEFLMVSGVGPKKLAQYGAEFLSLINGA